MVVLKRKKAALFAFVVLLIVGGVAVLATIKFREHKSVLAKPSQAEVLTQKYRIENLSKQVADSETIVITNLLFDKKYSEVIAKAKYLCTNVKGNDQAVCYNTYAQALMGMNDLKTLVTVAKEALKIDSVQQNESYKAGWLRILSNAEKGINPNSSSNNEDT